MSLLSMTRSGLDAYLKVIRWPIDQVVGRVAGGSNGTKSTAELAVDRVDATVRGAAGSIIGDDKLVHEANRRETAADQRERALKLREEAEERKRKTQARAKRTEQQRKTASRKAEAQTKEVIEQQAKRERLDALQEESKALEERSDAVTSRDEAQRLGKAAAAVKAERKSS